MSLIHLYTRKTFIVDATLVPHTGQQEVEVPHASHTTKCPHGNSSVRAFSF